MQIKITNKIDEQINKYKTQTGTSKIFIAKQLDMSPQNMYQICKTSNLTLETLIKFSIILKCKVSDLYEYKIIE